MSDCTLVVVDQDGLRKATVRKPSDCRGDELCFCVRCLDVGKVVKHPENRA